MNRTKRHPSFVSIITEVLTIIWLLTLNHLRLFCVLCCDFSSTQQYCEIIYELPKASKCDVISRTADCHRNDQFIDYTHFVYCGTMTDHEAEFYTRILVVVCTAWICAFWMRGSFMRRTFSGCHLCLPFCHFGKNNRQIVIVPCTLLTKKKTFFLYNNMNLELVFYQHSRWFRENSNWTKWLLASLYWHLETLRRMWSHRWSILAVTQKWCMRRPLVTYLHAPTTNCFR